MDKTEVIKQVEMNLPKEILYGTMNGKPFKLFLETKFIECVKEGAQVDKLVEFISTKISPQVVKSSNKDIFMSYIKENIKRDVLKRPIKHGTVEDYIRDVYLVEVEDLEIIDDATLEIVVKEIEEVVLPKLQEKTRDKKEIYVEEFIKTQKNFIAQIMIGGELIETRDFLMSKLSFMDDDFLISVGPNKKTIEEVYHTFLNNQEEKVSLIDKMELCADFTRYMEEEVLDSLMEEYQCTFREYIEEIVPSIMSSATEVSIGGNTWSVSEFVEEKLEAQKQVLLEQKKKDELETVEKLNRTGENPGLVTEIKLELSGGKLEATGEIPIVSSSLLTEEEITALTHLPFDQVKDIESISIRLLNALKESIYHTTNEHDLQTKEKEVQDIVSGLGTNYSLELQTLVDSIVALVTKKRNDMIRIEGNKEDYAEALVDELKAIQGTIKLADNVDSYSIIKVQLNRILSEINEKGIRDTMVIDTLYDTEKKLHRVFWKYYYTMEDFDLKKNAVIALINDSLSVIKNNEIRLATVIEERERQNIMIDTDVKRDVILNAFEEARKGRILTEAEIEQFSNELETNQYAAVVL